MPETFCINVETESDIGTDIGKMPFARRLTGQRMTRD
jgi:hypothetical protein